MKVLENRLAPEVVTHASGYLLRFDTALGDKILRSCAVKLTRTVTECSCAVKITHTVTEFSPIKYVLTRDKILVTEVVTTRGSLSAFCKRDSRSLVTERFFYALN